MTCGGDITLQILFINFFRCVILKLVSDRRIKSNIPSRIAFSVIDWRNSHTILDQSGAEKLLGRGDMLFLRSGTRTLIHAQAPFITDDEIEAVVSYISEK